MEMIMLSLSIIIFVCSFLIIFLHSWSNKKNRKESTTIQNEVIEIPTKTPPFINKRKNFRVNVDRVYCIVKFNRFGDQKFQRLKNKTIEGYIEDISLSGIKFVSDYELPVRSDINILISFQLDSLVFSLKGKIVRRHDHLNNKNVTYGIEFADLLPNQEKQLNSWLNRELLINNGKEIKQIQQIK